MPEQATATPAEKRARAALEKALSREAQKKKETKQKLAAAITSKLDPIIAQSMAVTTKPAFEQVPQAIRQPVVDMLDRFKGYVVSSKTVIGGGDAALPDMKDCCMHDRSLVVVERLAALQLGGKAAPALHRISQLAELSLWLAVGLRSGMPLGRRGSGIHGLVSQELTTQLQSHRKHLALATNLLATIARASSQ